MGLLLAAVLVLSTSVAEAQPPGAGSGGYFAAPVIKYTRLREQDAVMFGGRGGWYVTPSLVLGGGLYGTMTEVDAPSGVPYAPAPLDLEYEAFGFEVEYHFSHAAPTHFTLAAFLGGAAARYTREGTNEQHGETDFQFLLEPAVGVEQAISRRARVNLAASYRLSGEVEQVGLSESDVGGPALTLSLKLGRF